LIGIVTLLAVSAIASGCGGGDAGVTSEEYFQQLEGVVADLDQQTETLANEREENLASAGSDQEHLVLIRDFYYDLFSLIGDFRDDLAGIEPSKEVEEAHNDLVGRADEFFSVWSEISDELKSAASEAELEELLTNDEFVAVGHRFEEACFELQRVADDKGIDVDLQCGD
jgi:hypothetical protein